MSHYISLSRYVIDIPTPSDRKLPWWVHGSLYLPIELGGDNNMISNQDGRFSRSWSSWPIEHSVWELMKSVACVSAACEGGTLTLNGRATKAENYIKAWRSAANNPIPADVINRVCPEFLTIEFQANNVPSDLAKQLLDDYGEEVVKCNSLCSDNEVHNVFAKINFGISSHVALYCMLKTDHNLKLYEGISIKDQDHWMLQQFKNVA